MRNNEALAISPWKAWMMATRPKTLTTALIPILLGTVLAAWKGAPVEWALMLYAMASAVSIQIGTNLINDALDFKKGTDTNARIGPVRVSQSGLISAQQVLCAGFACFFIALLFGIPLVAKGGMTIFLIILISVLCGYLYTGGPYPLSYYGLGDPFVLFFYGYVAPSTMYVLQTGQLDNTLLLGGTQTGLLAVALIAINNFRDHEGDARANKRTLAVRFGKNFARCEITAAILIPFALGVYWISLDAWMAAILPIFSLPIAIIVIDYLWKHEPTKKLNTYFALAGLLHLAFGSLLCLGLYLS